MEDGCTHGSSQRLTSAEVGQRLSAAEARWAAEGERMTEPRRRVFELLLSAGEPVKAYDLMDRYGTGGAAAKPPTVYRALEFQRRKGVAHRIASTNAYIACSVGSGDHLAAFLICDCCGETAEISAPAAPIQKEAERQHFRLEQITIEARGRCVRCESAVLSA